MRIVSAFSATRLRSASADRLARSVRTCSRRSDGGKGTEDRFDGSKLFVRQTAQIKHLDGTAASAGMFDLRRKPRRVVRGGFGHRLELLLKGGLVAVDLLASRYGEKHLMR